MPTRYRKFGRADVAAAQRLSSDLGWPHRLEDWKFVQRLGAGYVAVDGRDVVGTVLTWKHDRRHASLGMVIVDPRYRRRGIGRRLMRLALRDVSGRVVWLNATRDGLPLYEELGFKTVDVVEQHQGNAAPAPALQLARDERLRPVGASDMPKLAAIASQAAGMSRARVLARLLEVGEGIVLARGEEVVGFAVFRRFGRGYVIGPVVAPDAGRAKALATHFAAMHPGEFLRIDIPASTGLGEWLDGIGLAKVDTVVTMVKGNARARPADMRTYALVNQALG